MKVIRISRVFVDVMMTILFLLLMAYHVTENFLHEWLGVVIFVLFFIHNVLNRKWYSSIFKVRFSAVGFLYLFINLSLLISVICVMISGILISYDVFGFLNLSGGECARQLHKVSAAWGYLFFSSHVGLHLGIIISTLNKLTCIKKISVPVKVILPLLVAGYGVYAFISQQIINRLFLLTEFTFFNFEEPVVFFFVDYISILLFFSFLTFYLIKLQHYLLKK